MGYIVSTWSRTPDTWTQDFQFAVNKILISSKNDDLYTIKKSEDGSNVLRGIPSMTEDEYISQGMDTDELQDLNLAHTITKREFPMESEGEIFIQKL